MSAILTDLETRALKATSLAAFPLNLNKVRSTIEAIMSEWRTAGFFSEYTDHSFNHVKDMLKTAEWIIPEQTKAELTPADCLMLVLSIYLHDVGLLITKTEYDTRTTDPDYKLFLENPILTTDKDAQFKAKIAQLSPEDSERLKYQEYVRFNHGKRVRSWIEGTTLANDELQSQRVIIEELLRPLDHTIRRDLALLCESHTLNDIANVSVLKTSRPYGTDEETVNLQYCAAVLRTVDLLQITQRRAPAVLYQLVNPSDPVSQLEWQKQGAVRSVRPAPGRDQDGAVSENVLSETIEVHATFREPDGFFGLTSFLAYAQNELAETHAAIQKSSRDLIKKYIFPWRRIDTDSIDTDGFLTDSFEFELDQHKILDLLTGHTLYNDTSVVLRELTQNALDAVRLQCEIDKVPSQAAGRVEIRWNEKERSLTISDNGTGMSQEVIEKHLLKVGSSRYQDAKFKEKYPTFHSISRFGIGVLSAFMVSDDVEITTCSEDDDRARRIALRSVHGKYLIKLLDKISDRDDLPMYPHGTSVRMIVRPTAEIGDVLQIAKSWLIFPRCHVTVVINDEPPVKIGYTSPKEALLAYLNSSHTHKSRFKREFDVREVSKNGITLAFAVAKDDLFKDWSFVEVPRSRQPYEDDEESWVPMGTCIEGVAVESDTPGYKGRTILAVANAIGQKAPKTNVARSALEDTIEQREMLSAIYSLYAGHISDEIIRLSQTDGHSLSRAVSMAPWIAAPLLSNPASKQNLLTEAISDVPLILVENIEKRLNVSFKYLMDKAEFWTVESPLYRSVEYFIKEAPSEVTSRKILSTLGNKSGAGGDRLIACNLVASRYVNDNVKDKFEVTEVIASEENRQIELRWKKIGQTRNWLSAARAYESTIQNDRKFWPLVGELRERFRQTRQFTNYEGLNVPVRDFTKNGLGDAKAFIVDRERYLTFDAPLTQYILKIDKSGGDDKDRVLVVLFAVIEFIRDWRLVNSAALERMMRNSSQNLQSYLGDLDELSEILRTTGQGIFDPFAWDRRDNSDYHPGASYYVE